MFCIPSPEGISMPDPTLQVKWFPSSSVLPHGKIRGEKALQCLQTLIYIKALRGMLQSLSIPRGHHWLCPAMQQCSRLAQLLSDLEGLKSRSKAGSGLMKEKPLWKQIRTGSQTVTNRIINGMPSLPVFPSFVSLVVPWFLLCLLGKRGNQISKLIPCRLEYKKFLHAWTYSDAKYSPVGVFFTALLLFFSLEVNFCKELQNSVLLVCLN